MGLSVLNRVGLHRNELDSNFTGFFVLLHLIFCRLPPPIRWRVFIGLHADYTPRFRFGSGFVQQPTRPNRRQQKKERKKERKKEIAKPQPGQNLGRRRLMRRGIRAVFRSSLPSVPFFVVVVSHLVRSRFSFFLNRR